MCLYLHSDLSLQVKYGTHNVMGLLKKFQISDAFQIFRLGMFDLHLTRLARRRDVLTPLAHQQLLQNHAAWAEPLGYTHLGWGAVGIALALAQSWRACSLVGKSKWRQEERLRARGGS